ncbi:MAG: GNAT family N-acetyltransferase, partial [Rubrobacter sp.]|nr:GNAT family N-acetyltransferase [Rubrobacter sp.]
LMPLMLERKLGFGRLLFIGTPITDHLDVLARESWEDRVAEAGIRALGQIGSWRVADLQEVRPEAVAWGIFRGWNRPRIYTRQSSCPTVIAKPWEELIKSLSRNERRIARQTLRRAKEDGVCCALASQGGTEQAARTWLALHRGYWRERGINPEHLTSRFGSHMVAAATRLWATESGGIYEFLRGEEVVASDFVLVGRQYVGSYLANANEYGRRRFQIHSLFMRNWINVALERGIPEVNMLRGEFRQKLRWDPRIVPNHRIILGRGWVSLIPYGGYHLLRSRVARYIKSERTPQWVKNAIARLKMLLPI